MENITVPITPVEKEDQIAKKIIKVSTKQPDEPARNAESVPVGNDEYDCSEDLEFVLLGMGMEKYIDLFIKSGVTLETFLQMDETDFSELGITDANDIKNIAGNLKIYQTNQKKFEMPENPLHDLQIAKNLSNELTLLENYCKYLEIQMRKRKLTDYRINLKESASTYLKEFAKSAGIQSKIISRRVFQDSNDNHLIGKALKMNNLTLTEHLKEKLKKKKPKVIKKMTIILGILSLVILFSFYKSHRI